MVRLHGAKRHTHAISIGADGAQHEKQVFTLADLLSNVWGCGRPAKPATVRGAFSDTKQYELVRAVFGASI
jgi:hypothetical protein